ncbi:MAG: hypothetical protein JSV05_06165 [Candidatus Bathyarchaeota archaeon]|nr:MAG: hypothetical protein JSV05_06165 [Candidatus Bathyarchaeota archaeon]
MKSKLKIISVVLVVAAIVGALVYLPLTSALESSENNDIADEGNFGDFKGLRLIWWLLNNSEPVEVEGEAVMYYKDMLVINTNNGQARIALPEEWIVGADVIPREILFESGYLSVGETVNVKALRTNVFEKTAFSIYFLISYEIVNSEGVHAYAAVPFNIET